MISRVGSLDYEGERFDFATERITIEPFDLRMKPKYSLVIDRLAAGITTRASGSRRSR